MTNEQINENVKKLRELSELLKSIGVVIPPNGQYGIKPGEYDSGELLHYIADMIER